jgi:hypothetical protein
MEKGAASVVVAEVRKGRRQYTVALVDLEVVEKETKTANWLAAYRYWPGKRKCLASDSWSLLRLNGVKEYLFASPYLLESRRASPNLSLGRELICEG